MSKTTYIAKHGFHNLVTLPSLSFYEIQNSILSSAKPSPSKAWKQHKWVVRDDIAITLCHVSLDKSYLVEKPNRRLCIGCQRAEDQAIVGALREAGIQ